MCGKARLGRLSRSSPLRLGFTKGPTVRPRDSSARTFSREADHSHDTPLSSVVASLAGGCYLCLCRSYICQTADLVAVAKSPSHQRKGDAGRQSADSPGPISCSGNRSSQSCHVTWKCPLPGEFGLRGGIRSRRSKKPGNFTSPTAAVW